jgi:hypothetical protein
MHKLYKETRDQIDRIRKEGYLDELPELPKALAANDKNPRALVSVGESDSGFRELWYNDPAAGWVFLGSGHGDDDIAAQRAAEAALGRAVATFLSGEMGGGKHVGVGDNDTPELAALRAAIDRAIPAIVEAQERNKC